MRTINRYITLINLNAKTLFKSKLTWENLCYEDVMGKSVKLGYEIQKFQPEAIDIGHHCMA